MLIVEKINELQLLVKTAKQTGQNVGFVPTMGFLHQGHLSLIQRAKQENQLVVVSIFVNPIQFGPQEDFQTYPRNLQSDQELAAMTGADILFVPQVEEMYPTGFQTYVEIIEVSQGLCGGQRPGHFRGVATVVLKLFNIVEPDRAYFGEKDAQQLRVIQRMAIDLNLNIAVIGCPIIREIDGLAMSSRNSYLKSEERKAATILYRSLQAARQQIESGERDSGKVRQTIAMMIESEPLAKTDYIEIVASTSLKPLPLLSGKVLIALAIKVGSTRLIDNEVIEID